ncbi:hypothetical protein U0070_011374 [Myodes glareolus]|uniref:Protein chibby homolog 2 n=1 Tax=Myodes glareolus TaxID=447135 RepID=A0AAW0HY94_MYOGA
MSPLECSECFGDQFMHRTYTWHLTLRGTTEPFLRLHNLYSTPRCSRQAALPRMIRRVVSQHSYPLNCFSSVPFDPMERPTSQADLELDYNPPRVQLSDEMFVFQDGRWVNETCRLQSPYFSPSSSFHHKLHHKRQTKEYVLQKENKSLRDENRALRDENKALRKENKILQVFWEEHEVTLGQEESQSSAPLLHKDAASQEAVKKENASLSAQHSKENTLQLIREENWALQQLLEQRQAYWAQAEDNATSAEESKPISSPKEEPHNPGLLPDQSPGLSAAFEEPKGPPATQEDSKTPRALREMVNNLSSGEEDCKVAPNLGDSTQSLQLLREMNQALQALHVLREEYCVFQEENKALRENSKLKLQQLLVIDTMTEVTAQMEMLIEELYAFMPAKNNKGPKKPSRV